MSTQTIQLGIDLGTTNSEIAISNNGNIEIVKNIFGDEYTPSVFGIDRSKNKIVGKRAYEKLYKEASLEEFNNNKAEVKRLMGTSETVTFERSKEELNAEQISSEILKSLKEDVLRKYPHINTDAAVITVPAYFSILQSEATKRAGNLAGFKYVVLLQEPIAAAVAYGFMNAANENWLVYDFGGGTFDVALISSKDGVLSVLGHNGDNFLGGKDFDRLIVEKIILPEIKSKFSLSNFTKSNDKYKSIFAKLKYIAENAKIYLSQYETTNLEIEGIGNDDNGKEIYLNVNFTRVQFEQLMKDSVDRTIELSKQTLKDSGINAAAVKRVVLVGGPTQIPYIRNRIEKELQVKIDTSVDPLTVVAKGACIYGLNQKLPKELMQDRVSSLGKGVRAITLNYEPMTADDEETVSGTVDSLKDSKDDYFIQIQSESGTFSGTKKQLKNGSFFDSLPIESNKSNLFWIYLFDKEGNSVTIDPDSFSITHGLTVSSTPISHSIGISVADKASGVRETSQIDKYEILFEKGSRLPLKKTEKYKTARRLKKNEKENPLWIVVGEGESEIPDRNIYVCQLGIDGSSLPYDLPQGTDIEVTVTVNESREMEVIAYIPLIDLRVNARSTVRDEIIDTADLENDLNNEIERSNSVLASCKEDDEKIIKTAIQNVTVSLRNAHLDEDEKRKANKQLKDLKILLDKVEREMELPTLISEFRQKVTDVREVLNDYADKGVKDAGLTRLERMEKEGEEAITDNDKTLLIRVIEEVRELGFKALFSNPATWVYQFQKITSENHTFTNDKEAQYFIDKGNRAINSGDEEGLKGCVQNLMNLLPEKEQEMIRSNLSGITR